jgi:CBS domain-containing protein
LWIGISAGGRMKPVSELLSTGGTLWYVHPDDTVFDALKILADHDVGALMVMDGPRLVGIVSERDYTRKVALQARSSKDTKVSEIMTTTVFSVTPNTRTRVCMALMSEKKFRHLPVIDGNNVLGMISIRDIMNDIIADNEVTIAHLQQYINS